MPDLVQLAFADAAYIALPFGIAFPTRADACSWLSAHGYEPQDQANTIWTRTRG